MILFPFCIHNILSTLSGVHFSFKASLTWLGTAAVSSLLRRVFMKLDWGVPLVTTISSPSCVHSSFVNFPGVNLSFNNSLTRSGMVVLLPLLRTVVSRSTSFVKAPYVCYKSQYLLTWSYVGANYKFQRLPRPQLGRFHSPSTTGRGPLIFPPLLYSRPPCVLLIRRFSAPA